MHNIVNTTLRGFVPLCAFGILVFVFSFIFGFIRNIVAPISKVLSVVTDSPQLGVDIFVLLTIFLICFFIGLVIETKAGSYIKGKFESLLMRIPGAKVYQIASEILSQLFNSRDGDAFSDVAFVKPYGKNGCTEIGFVTSRFKVGEEEYISIFDPTGPNPTTGFVRVFSPSEIIMTKKLKRPIPIDKAMRVIVSCGVGMEGLFKDFTEEDAKIFNSIQNESTKKPAN